jgi:hypothetical protein
VRDYYGFALIGKRPKILKIYISAGMVSVAYAGLVGIAAIRFINVLPQSVLAPLPAADPNNSATRSHSRRSRR